MMEENLLTKPEARAYLGGVSESTFDRLLRERKIPFIRIRQRVIRIRTSDLDHYLLNGLVGPRQDKEGKA